MLSKPLPMLRTTIRHAAGAARLTLAALGLSLGLAASSPALAAPDGSGFLSALDNASGAAKEKPHVEVSLAAASDALTPQAENRLAVVFRHEKGWHTYWTNPGDAGLPPEFTFTLPQGFSATAPLFPLPERILTGGLTSFGYEGETLFPFRVEVPRSAGTSGHAVIRVHVEYLACKDMCVPGSADASIRLPLRVSANPSADAAAIDAALKTIPEHVGSDNFAAVSDGRRIRLDIASEGLVKRSLDFIPAAQNVMNYSAPAVFEQHEDGSASLYFEAAGRFAKEWTKAPPSSLSGLLIADGGPKAGGWAVEASFPLAAGDVGTPTLQPSAAAEAIAESGSLSFSTWTALAFALAGGLILNLMPCVFPVLSLKLLQLVGGAQKGERLLPHGIAFTAGVLITMGILSGVLMALRGAGSALGWGFQLQEPWVVGVLILLFAAITLNLLGLYEFTAGSGIANAAAVRKGPRAGVLNSFMTGILAVVVASPCTAPFMGAAVGFALTQPAAEAIFVFLSLGLGMALPWLLLCIFPAWAKRLPKPGPWMTVFRKVMAIPMACAVVWLGWVLSKQVNFYGMLLVVIAVAAAAVFLWLIGREQWGRGRNRTLKSAMGLVAVAAIAAAGSGGFSRATAVQGYDDGWAPWSESAVAEALAAGKPVFVDFTAAWCVTCQANKLAALDRSEVVDAFDKGGYVRLMGDWTNRSDDITAVLARFGRSGVPLYLIYRPDGRVEVLPELLTPSVVLEALKKK